MIRHVLLFKFNEGVGEDLQEHAVDRLRQLGDLCPTIGAWSIGVNFTDSPSAYDVIEIGDFASVEDLDEYKAHPEHRDFSDFIRPLASWALADYEAVDSSDADPSEIVDLDFVKEIPAISLALKGAAYNNSSRGNSAYRQLRSELEVIVGDSLSSSQVGRLLVKLVRGKVPQEMFTHLPEVAVTYNATIQNKEDLRSLRSCLGDDTANHLLFMFHKLSTNS